eukprot:scaffold15947_cov67-Phaeocystis_antarctica.AAC.2
MAEPRAALAVPRRRALTLALTLTLTLTRTRTLTPTLTPTPTLTLTLTRTLTRWLAAALSRHTEGEEADAYSAPLLLTLDLSRNEPPAARRTELEPRTSRPDEPAGTLARLDYNGLRPSFVGCSRVRALPWTSATHACGPCLGQELCAALSARGLPLLAHIRAIYIVAGVYSRRPCRPGDLYILKYNSRL